MGEENLEGKQENEMLKAKDIQEGDTTLDEKELKRLEKLAKQHAAAKQFESSEEISELRKEIVHLKKALKFGISLALQPESLKMFRDNFPLE